MNSSRIEPEESTNLSTSGSCSLLLMSAASSAHTAKYLEDFTSLMILSWIHCLQAAMRSFWMVGERYCAFLSALEKWSCSNTSPASIRNCRRDWKLPGLPDVAKLFSPEYGLLSLRCPRKGIFCLPQNIIHFIMDLRICLFF